jgi:cytoskeleton protein RodZ
MPEIGATLREARMRARIDVSEIEATTKIRAKYLRALENEEWGLLPGPTFVKSFLRTYAQALGLDGKSLVEEYRQSEEGAGDPLYEPIVSSPGRTRPRRERRDGGGTPSRGYLTAVSVIGAIIVLLIVLLIVGSTGGGSSGTHTASTTSATTGTRAARRRHAHRAGVPPATGIVSLQLRPSALIYVCLVGDGGRVLIPGAELKAGEITPVYHARRFEITIGNSEVSLIIDGTPRAVAPSSEAIGYAITKAYGRQPLTPGHLPTCTS